MDVAVKCYEGFKRKWNFRRLSGYESNQSEMKYFCGTGAVGIGAVEVQHGQNGVL